jgi:hypothetical protein
LRGDQFIFLILVTMHAAQISQASQWLHFSFLPAWMTSLYQARHRFQKAFHRTSTRDGAIASYPIITGSGHFALQKQKKGGRMVRDGKATCEADKH